MTRVRALAALFATCLFASSAVAGVTWTSKGTEEGKEVTRTIRIAGQAMRIDSGDETVIVRLDRGLMWTVTPSAKTYNEITFAELGAAMDEMQKALAGLSPQERAMVEALAGGMASGPPAITVTETGEKKTVAGHPCSVWRIDGGMTRSTICAATDLKFDAEARDFFRTFGETLAKSTGLDAFRAQVDAYNKIQGVPVEESVTVTVLGQERTDTWVLVSLESGDVPGGVFDLPEGLKKVDSGLPGAGASGRDPRRQRRK